MGERGVWCGVCLGLCHLLVKNKNLSEKATEEKENLETLPLNSKISVHSVANFWIGIKGEDGRLRPFPQC